MQEAGAGASPVTTPGECHQTAPSTTAGGTALHILATCDPPKMAAAMDVTAVAQGCRSPLDARNANQSFFDAAIRRSQQPAVRSSLSDLALSLSDTSSPRALSACGSGVSSNLTMDSRLHKNTYTERTSTGAHYNVSINALEIRRQDPGRVIRKHPEPYNTARGGAAKDPPRVLPRAVVLGN